MMLDLSERVVVIVGGGAVAARKARGLIEAGAGCVRCVAPTFHEGIPAEVQRVGESYRAAHLDGAALVFAATDRADVNDAVVRDAHARNLLVNRADAGADTDSPGDFVIPATHVSGALTLTVSAGSPALSAFVRDRLAASVDPRWEMMATLMRALRPRVLSAGLEIEKRREIFRDLATDAALAVLGDGGPDALRAWLRERHPELAHA